MIVNRFRWIRYGSAASMLVFEYLVMSFDLQVVHHLPAMVPAEGCVQKQLYEAINKQE